MFLFKAFLICISFSIFAMDVPVYKYEPLPEDEIDFSLSDCSTEFIVGQVETNLQFARKASEKLDQDRKDEIIKQLKEKHTLLFYTIFKKLNPPQCIFEHHATNYSLTGFVHVVSSGYLINSNPNLNTTEIWQLENQSQVGSLPGIFSALTLDDRFLLLKETNNTYSLYEVKTAEKKFTCQMDDSDIIIYDQEKDQFIVGRNMRNNVQGLNRFISQENKTSYLFLENSDFAFTLRQLNNSEFFQKVLESHTLKNRHTVRIDNHYALLETSSQLHIFDLRTMLYCTMNTGFLSTMSKESSIMVKRPSSDANELEVFNLQDHDKVLQTLRPPSQALRWIENICVSPNGKYTIAAYINTGGVRRNFVHSRCYLLFDNETGNSTELFTNIHQDLQGISSSRSEHMMFLDNEKFCIARDSVYLFDLQGPMPNLTLEQYSFIIQASKNGLHPEHKEIINTLFDDQALKNALYQYFYN